MRQYIGVLIILLCRQPREHVLEIGIQITPVQSRRLGQARDSGRVGHLVATPRQLVRPGNTRAAVQQAGCLEIAVDRACLSTSGTVGPAMFRTAIVAVAPMLTPSSIRFWLVIGITSMRCGFDGRAAKAQMHLESGPFGRYLFAFRSRRGDRIKELLVRRRRVCLSCKCLEAGRFVWSQVEERHMGKDASAGCGWPAWVVSKYGKILLPLLEMHLDIVHTSPRVWR